METTNLNREKLLSNCNMDNSFRVIYFPENDTSLHSDEHDIGPLHVASALGVENVLNTLLLQETEVDKDTNVGWTPLMCAARNGRQKVVQRLIEHGANVHHCNKLGTSVLAAAAASGNIEVIKIILNTFQDGESLQDEVVFSMLVAALYGHSNILDLLISSHPPSVNFCDKYGITPLMLAVAGGHEEAVKILLDSGADPNIKNSHSFTAFDVASVMQYSNILCLLEERTERVEERMSIDYDPLGVGSDLIEEYGWSALCSPQPRMTSSLNSFKDNAHRKIPVKALNIPFNLIPPSSSDISHDAKENHTNAIIPFVTSYPCVCNNTSIAPSNTILRNSTPTHVKSSIHVPVPPLSPYTDSSLPFNFVHSAPQQEHGSLDNLIYNDLCQIQPVNDCSLTMLQNSLKCDDSIKLSSPAQINYNGIQTKINDGFNIRLWWSEKIVKRLNTFTNSWRKEAKVMDDNQSSQDESKSQAENSLYSSSVHRIDAQSKCQEFERNYFKKRVNTASSSASFTLTSLLANLKLQTYIPLFLEHEVDMDSFLMLNQEDLEEMGITSPKSQRKLLKVIAVFKGNS